MDQKLQRELVVPRGTWVLLRLRLTGFNRFTTLSEICGNFSDAYLGTPRTCASIGTVPTCIEKAIVLYLVQ